MSIDTAEPKPAEGASKRVSRRRKTSHLKKVPTSKALRESLREKCRDVAAMLDRSRPLTKDEMEVIVRRMLESEGLEEGYLGWLMVVLSSCFWEDKIQSIPHSRRLFLLPHCLKHADGCPADYDDFGLACKKCGACSIADFRSTAEELGYKVLVAEGSPIVLKIIVSGHVDAIVGVACLNVLEKAIDKILLAGIPCMAVPLLSSDCRNTSVDEDWVSQMIQVPHKDVANKTRSYLHLMRTASKLFSPERLEELIPRIRNSSFTDDVAQTDPVAVTESIGYDFLARGGKQSRPFIALAVRDSLLEGRATLDPAVADEIPHSALRVAMAIETFHKASLVHDDIEDNDQYRYGSETIHEQYGVATAINVGDYLVGMGYRIVSRDVAELGAETAADVLAFLSDAHVRLCEGQGAELHWRDRLDKRLKPIDALKIYALKTAPAFEAALFCGARLAGPIDEYREPFRAFARNLGVAFQILNDLKDWDSDDTNKKLAGGDILSGRPTILWALALEKLPQQLAGELLQLPDRNDLTPHQRISRARQLYFEAGVFDTAMQLVEKHQVRAEQIADEIRPDELRRLMYYIVDTVLDYTAEVKPTIAITDLSWSQVVPIVT